MNVPGRHFIEEHPGYVEVRGVSRGDIETAFEVYEQVQAVRAELAAANRERLVLTLMASDVPLTPPASLAQAQRLASRRDALLATPVYTHATLREMRGDARESSTRTWLARRRDAHELFSLTHDGRTLIPAFQFDGHGRPRPELQPILATLGAAGVHGWPLWTWLVTPTSLLSGEVPEQLAGSDPKRALRAAQRFVAATAA
jgi:hypothetical protein